jgi:aerobic carbon-monoxide dehydrogenase large subunit
VLHAAILRSPIAHGHIRSIDPAAALACPGVHAVITAADIGSPVPRIPIRLQPLPVLEPFHQPVIAYDKVRYVGEPIAVALAESAALAEDALAEIRIDIEPLPAMGEWRRAAEGDTLLFEEAGTNLAIEYTAAKGDPDRVWAGADYVRRERFAVQRHTAVMMEPRGVLAEWDAVRGRLVVSGAAKVPFFNRRILAALIGLAEDAIELVENDVGGGFGVRGEFYPEDFLIPFAARFSGHPVKWVEDRREHLTAANHAREAECELQIACRYDGTILALAGDVRVDLGAYARSNGMVGRATLPSSCPGPIAFPTSGSSLRCC